MTNDCGIDRKVANLFPKNWQIFYWFEKKPEKQKKPICLQPKPQIDLLILF